MIFYEEDKSKYQIVPGMHLKEEQLEAIDFILHKFNCVINLSTGLGKCKKAGSRVLTRDGYKKIEDLMPNAKDGFSPLKIEVWTGKEWAYTKNFYKERQKVVRNLILSDGTVCNGTLEHPVSVFNGNIELKKIGDIKEGEYLAFSRKVPEFGHKVINEYEAYLLGLWIGDGSHGVDHSNGHVSYAIEGEEEVISKVSEYFGARMLYTNNNTCKINIPWGSHFRSFLNKEEGERHSWDKIIPECMFNATNIEREAMFWGLVDSDGSVDGVEKEGIINPGGSGLDYVTKSKDLAENMIHLNHLLGLRAKFTEKILNTGKYKGNKYYRFNYNREDLYRKQWEFNPEWSRKWRNLKRIQWNTINSTDSILISKERANLVQFLISCDKDQIDRSDKELIYKYNTCRSQLARILKDQMTGIVSIHTDYFEVMRPYVQDLIPYRPVRVVGYKDEICDVYDIEMDTEDHVFYSDGLINHNTCTTLVASYKIMSKTNDTVTFIVCPKQANTAFKKEFKRMGIPYSISVTGERSIKKNARYFIWNYSNPDEMIQVLMKIKEKGYRVIGIFDEVHKLGNPSSGITQKMWSIRKYFSACIGVSATPLLNDFQGLWAVCNFVRPNYMGNWWEFKSRWLIIQKRTIRVRGGKSRTVEDIIGYNNLDVLRDTLKEFIITRTYEYPLRYYYRDCTLSEEEMKIYELAARGILDEDDVKEDYAPRLWNLQRVADGCDEKSRSLGVTSKQKLLLKVLKEVLDRDEGTLIYVELEDTYTMLGELLEKYRGYLGYHKLWYITGKVEYDKRVKCEKNLQARDIVIITQAGSACFSKGTEVIMADGSLRKIEDIKKGDSVMGEDSSVKVVEEVHRGKSKLYRIRQSQAEDYVVNENHILTLMFNRERKTYGFSKGDILNISVKEFLSKSKYFKSCFRGFKLGYEGEEQEYDIPPYMLGLWLGDGDKYHSALYVNDYELEIAESWKEYGRDIGLDCRVEEGAVLGDREPHCHKYILTSHINGKRNQFTSGLRKYGILEDKRIPEIYYHGSRRQRLELFAGIVNTDGNKHRESICVGTTVKNLAEDYKRLGDSLGYKTHIGEYFGGTGFRNKKKEYGLVYTVSFVGFFDDVPFLLDKKKPERRREFKDYRLSKIDVEEVGIGDYYGFSIDGETKLFMLKDGTIVHNSINLQKVNNVIFYDYSFSAGSIIQAIGRVARVDSPYDNQNIIFLEAKDTIDSYKRLLMQSNMTVIQEVFGKSQNMPYFNDKGVNNDIMKRYRQWFKNNLLWKR